MARLGRAPGSIALLGSLLLSPVSAQTSLPSAPLQMSLSSASLPVRVQRRDLFRARGDTFAPRFDEPPEFDPRFPPCCHSLFGGPFVAVPPWTPPRSVVQHAPRRERRERILPRPAPPAERLPAAAPGHPKTFYVIPRCYAGDKPPERATLPPMCDMAKLRTIPPAVEGQHHAGSQDDR